MVWVVQGQGQNSEQKHKTKKHVEFHILTLLYGGECFTGN